MNSFKESRRNLFEWRNAGHFISNQYLFSRIVFSSFFFFFQHKNVCSELCQHQNSAKIFLYFSFKYLFAFRIFLFTKTNVNAFTLCEFMNPSSNVLKFNAIKWEFVLREKILRRKMLNPKAWDPPREISLFESLDSFSSIFDKYSMDLYVNIGNVLLKWFVTSSNYIVCIRSNWFNLSFPRYLWTRGINSMAENLCWSFC